MVWLDASVEGEPRYANMYGSHREWVEIAIREAGLHEEAHGTLAGMADQKRIFAAEAGRVGELEEARKLCLLDRCAPQHGHTATRRHGASPANECDALQWHTALTPHPDPAP